MNDIGQRNHAPEEGTAASAAPRRLVRYPDRGPGAGVAEGLGVYFGLDPVIFRIGFILLALAGGGGILLYLIGWIAMPQADVHEQAAVPGAPTTREETRRWAGWALIAVAVVLLAANPLSMPGRPGVVWALALIGVGVLVFQLDRSRPAAGAGEQPAPDAPPPPPPPPAPAERPAPSPLGRITAGVALLATGAAALLDSAGAFDMGVSEYLALLLAVVGGGLLVSTWWGRARGLIGAGVVLLALLLVSVTAGQAVHFRGGVGERAWAPPTAAAVEPRYELFAGEAVLDLSDIEAPGDMTVTAGVTFGSLQVIVPDDVGVRIDAQVTGGEINLFGVRTGGLGVHRSVEEAGPSGAPVLHLDLRNAFGEIVVRESRWERP